MPFLLIVIIAIAPGRTKAVADSIKVNTLSSLGWGALVLVAAPLALALIFITIIDIRYLTIDSFNIFNLVNFIQRRFIEDLGRLH